MVFCDWLFSHSCFSMYEYFNFVAINHFMYSSLMGIGVVCIFCILWIMLLWTLVYKFLCGYMFLFLLCINLGVELLGQVITLYLIFWLTARLFYKVSVPFYIFTISVWEFQSLHVFTNTLYYLNGLCKIQKYSAIISLNTFSSTFSLFSLAFPLSIVNAFNSVPHFSEALFISLFLFLSVLQIA